MFFFFVVCLYLKVIVSLRLECLFCEKSFKDRQTLKDHMRKKQHKKINPKNKEYDKYYIINYLVRFSILSNIWWNVLLYNTSFFNTAGSVARLCRSRCDVPGSAIFRHPTEILSCPHMSYIFVLSNFLLYCPQYGDFLTKTSYLWLQPPKDIWHILNHRL